MKDSETDVERIEAASVGELRPQTVISRRSSRLGHQLGRHNQGRAARTKAPILTWAAWVSVARMLAG